MWVEKPLLSQQNFFLRYQGRTVKANVDIFLKTAAEFAQKRVNAKHKYNLFQ